jgi:predicted PurR-regulated permease PerM
MGFWGFVFAVPVAAVLYSIGFVILERAVHQHDRETSPAPPADHS